MSSGANPPAPDLMCTGSAGAPGPRRNRECVQHVPACWERIKVPPTTRGTKRKRATATAQAADGNEMAYVGGWFVRDPRDFIGKVLHLCEGAAEDGLSHAEAHGDDADDDDPAGCVEWVTLEELERLRAASN